MEPTKAIELLTLILKGDDPQSHPDYRSAIRFAIQVLGDQMLHPAGILNEKET